MKQIKYEKDRSRQQKIDDQQDAIKILDLLQKVKDFEYDKAKSVFTARLSSPYVYDELIKLFSKESCIKGEEESATLPGENDVETAAANGDEIEHNKKMMYLIKNCVVFLNPNMCINFQLVINENNECQINIIQCYAFLAMMGYKIRGGYPELSDNSIYISEKTALGTIYPIVFKSENDYSRCHNQYAKDVMKFVKFDLFVRELSTKFEVGSSRVRTDK